MIFLRQPAFGAHEIGLSLVELMIAMALGLAIVAGVSTLSLNATQSYRALNQGGELIENGQYALRILKNDLEHAGFFGVYDGYKPKPTYPAALPDPCNTEISSRPYDFWDFDYLFPVVGYGSPPDKCKEKIKNALSDILVIRRGDTSPIEFGKSADGDLHSKPDSFSFTPDDSKDIRKYDIHIYYIAIPSSGQNIPILYRFSPTDNNPIPQPIVDGIESLRLMFGVDGSLSSVATCNPDLTLGDGAPDNYFPLDSFKCWKDWSNVVSVRLDLLVRTTESDPNYTDAKTYSLGNVSFTPTEKNYRRRVYSQVVRLVNVSGRREK